MEKESIVGEITVPFIVGAEMSNSGANFESLIPENVVRSIAKVLSEAATGVVKASLSEASFFLKVLTGSTEFEIINIPSRPFSVTFFVEQNSAGTHTWSIKGVTWVGSEPSFETIAHKAYLVTVECVEGKLLAWAGLPGPAGANGHTIISVTTTPTSGEGNIGDIAVKSTSPIALWGPKTSEGWGSEKSLEGKEGIKGAEGPAGAGSPQAYIKLVTPIYSPSPIPNSEKTTGKYEAIFARVVIPKSGVLHDLSVYQGATSVGKHRVAVYDTGAAKAKGYRLLWQGAEEEHGTLKEWQKLGSPELSVSAEEVLLFAVMNNETTHTYGAASAPSSAISTQLPEGFIATPGETLPKLCGNHTFGALSYGTAGITEIEEANLIHSSIPVIIIARIV